MSMHHLENDNAQFIDKWDDFSTLEVRETPNLNMEE